MNEKTIQPKRKIDDYLLGTNMGVYSAEWDMSQFTDYNEPVTLQNA